MNGMSSLNEASAAAPVGTQAKGTLQTEKTSGSSV